MSWLFQLTSITFNPLNRIQMCLLKYTKMSWHILAFMDECFLNVAFCALCFTRNQILLAYTAERIDRIYNSIAAAMSSQQLTVCRFRLHIILPNLKKGDLLKYAKKEFRTAFFYNLPDNLPPFSCEMDQHAAYYMKKYTLLFFFNLISLTQHRMRCVVPLC